VIDLIKRLQDGQGNATLGRKEINYSLKVLTSGKFYESELVVKGSNGHIQIVNEDEEEEDLQEFINSVSKDQVLTEMSVAVS
jgi:hypothetical protein